MKDNTIKTSLGGPSIILVLLVLALSVFALLAVRSSISERRLADKTAESVADYYDMQAKASEIQFKLQSILDSGDEAELNRYCLELTGEDAKSSKDFSIAYDVQSETRDNMSIHVALKSSNNGVLQVAEWRLCSKAPEDGYELEFTD